jgi:hypothetical protein
MLVFFFGDSIADKNDYRKSNLNGNLKVLSSKSFRLIIVIFTNTEGL